MCQDVLIQTFTFERVIKKDSKRCACRPSLITACNRSHNTIILKQNCCQFACRPYSESCHHANVLTKLVKQFILQYVIKKDQSDVNTISHGWYGRLESGHTPDTITLTLWLRYAEHMPTPMSYCMLKCTSNIPPVQFTIGDVIVTKENVFGPLSYPISEHVQYDQFTAVCTTYTCPLLRHRYMFKYVSKQKKYQSVSSIKSLVHVFQQSSRTNTSTFRLVCCSTCTVRLYAHEFRRRSQEKTVDVLVIEKYADLSRMFKNNMLQYDNNKQEVVVFVAYNVLLHFSYLSHVLHPHTFKTHSKADFEDIWHNISFYKSQPHSAHRELHGLQWTSVVYCDCETVSDRRHLKWLRYIPRTETMFVVTQEWPTRTLLTWSSMVGVQYLTNYRLEKKSYRKKRRVHGYVMYEISEHDPPTGKSFNTFLHTSFHNLDSAQVPVTTTTTSHILARPRYTHTDAEEQVQVLMQQCGVKREKRLLMRHTNTMHQGGAAPPVRNALELNVDSLNCAYDTVQGKRDTLQDSLNKDGLAALCVLANSPRFSADVSEIQDRSVSNPELTQDMESVRRRISKYDHKLGRLRRMIVYNKKLLREKTQKPAATNQRECPICQDIIQDDVHNFAVGSACLYPCGHYYCRACALRVMFTSNPYIECPMCRCKWAADANIIRKLHCEKICNLFHWISFQDNASLRTAVPNDQHVFLAYVRQIYGTLCYALFQSLLFDNARSSQHYVVYGNQCTISELYYVLCSHLFPSTTSRIRLSTDVLYVTECVLIRYPTSPSIIQTRPNTDTDPRTFRVSCVAVAEASSVSAAFHLATTAYRDSLEHTTLFLYDSQYPTSYTDEETLFLQTVPCQVIIPNIN